MGLRHNKPLLSGFSIEDSPFPNSVDHSKKIFEDENVFGGKFPCTRTLQLISAVAETSVIRSAVA